MHPIQGLWLRSLVRKLRSHMPHGSAKKQTKCNKILQKKKNHYLSITWMDSIILMITNIKQLKDTEDKLVQFHVA